MPRRDNTGESDKVSRWKFKDFCWRVLRRRVVNGSRYGVDMIEEMPNVFELARRRVWEEDGTFDVYGDSREGYYVHIERKKANDHWIRNLHNYKSAYVVFNRQYSVLGWAEFDDILPFTVWENTWERTNRFMKNERFAYLPSDIFCYYIVETGEILRPRKGRPPVDIFLENAHDHPAHSWVPYTKKLFDLD